MCIRLAYFSPKEETKVEDIFKFHVDVHAPHIMQTVSEVASSGLQKYLIGRITSESIGKSSFSNYVQMWWNDEAAMNRYLEELKNRKLPDGNFQSGPQGELGLQVNWHCTAFVEEEVIFENKLTRDTAAIRLGVYKPKEGISIDEAFKSHIQTHSPAIMKLISEVATPGLNRYVVGKVTEVAKGEPLFTNYVKMWWEDIDSMNRYLQALEARWPLPGDDFSTKVDWGFTAFVNDEVVFQKE